jgi:hypothetical protein
MDMHLKLNYITRIMLNPLKSEYYAFSFRTYEITQSTTNILRKDITEPG